MAKDFGVELHLVLALYATSSAMQWRRMGWHQKESNQMDTKNISNISNRHDESVMDESVILSGDAFDPFTDAHTIEYWLWDGERLIPASTEESERFREREALLRLGYWTTQSEGSNHAQPTLWQNMVIAVQSMLDRLLA